MTAFGFEALKAELAHLRARRPAMVDEVATARSQGDLSENFAYHDARQNLGMLDGRIQTIEATLTRADVVEENAAMMSIASPMGSALLDRQAGDTVTFKTPGGERQATVVSVS